MWALHVETNAHERQNLENFKALPNGEHDLVELSVKYEKHSTRTLSLVMQRVRLKEKPAKKYISIQRGMKLRKPSILVAN